MMNIFGTDGIRNKVGQDYFDFQNLSKLALAISLWAKNNSNSNVLLACDTRISCDWIKSIIKSGLLCNGINVIDAGIITTPAVFHLMKNSSKFNLGIIVSASHNIYSDNGIKIVSCKTGKLSLSDELEISRLYHEKIDLSYESFGKDTLYSNSKSDYVSKITSMFDIELLSNKKVVLDLANGASCKIAPEIFKILGANIIEINNSPDGFNINKNCGATHLKHLQEIVIGEQADLGFAFDGDGDRVIAIDKLGQIKDGDDILAMLSNHPQYQEQSTIVGTVMSNQGLEAFLQKKSKNFIRSNVGDKYVLQELNKNNLNLGGEQSGHVILKDIISTGDGILTALKVCESAKINNNWDLITFEKYPQILINLNVKIKSSLTTGVIGDYIEFSKSQLKSGRLLVRYSGTENLLRIMVEEEDMQLAQAISQNLANILQKELC